MRASPRALVRRGCVTDVRRFAGATAAAAGLLRVVGGGAGPALAGPGDAVAPETALSTAVPDIVGPGRPVSVSFVGHDDVTATAALGFECSVDGAAFGSCTSPVVVPGSPSGQHQLRVRSVD